MQNIEKLFTNNRTLQKKLKFENGVFHIIIKSEDGLFSGKQINYLIGIINGLHKKYGRHKYHIYIHLGEITFIDKLTYVFLEIICEYLINTYGHYVQIFMDVKITIGTEGINSSPLLLLNDTKSDKVRSFPEKFKFDLYRNHFRKVVNGVGKEKTNYLGELSEQVDNFLKYFGIDDDCRYEVGHVISELVGNVGEHAKSECLIDIDVASQYSKADENCVDNKYYGINIAIINFSNKILGDDIYNNIIKGDECELNERQKTIKKVFAKHKDLFDEKYLIDDFANISAFQTKVSGRPSFDETGGTGLTVLIKSLEEKSDTNKCYVISGNRCVNFYHELLEYDIDGWIGFNENKDFMNCKPREGVLNDCLINMPGTAYNFNFVMKGDLIYE